MAEPLLAARGLIKRFGGLVATDGVALEIMPQEVHALIGPNGAGKTTLIGQLTGELAPDAGRVYFAGRDITRLSANRRARRGLARSFQIASLFLDLTALENVALAVQVHSGHSFRFWGAVERDARLQMPAQALLDRVGLAARADIPAGELSHGEHRQLEIALALASAPKVVLLDEPMAGMGPEESQRMIALLRQLKGGVGMLLVEHDMDAVFALADRISVLVYGKIIATGTPEAIRANAEVRQAYLGDEERRP
jgi:branched-chain amino acid transport system ATP-binding protein